MRHDITELFSFVDDFCKEINEELKKHQLPQSDRKPTRTPGLTDSEMVTILLMFQTSHMKDFKSFYLYYLPNYHDEFPQMPCYERFVVLQPRIASTMLLLFMSLRKNGSDNAFVDSTPIRVCHNKRIFNHKVFDGIAARGKSTMGWFFGFKLHLVIDEYGEIINAQLTPGNCDDRAPVEDLVEHFKGKLFGDKGYISKELFQNFVPRSNAKIFISNPITVSTHKYLFSVRRILSKATRKHKP